MSPLQLSADAQIKICSLRLRGHPFNVFLVLQGEERLRKRTRPLRAYELRTAQLASDLYQPQLLYTNHNGPFSELEAVLTIPLDAFRPEEIPNRPCFDVSLTEMAPITYTFLPFIVPQTLMDERPHRPRDSSRIRHFHPLVTVCFDQEKNVTLLAILDPKSDHRPDSVEENE
jgi:hypothetical protein